MEPDANRLEGRKVLSAIPVFNEESSLPGVLERLEHALPGVPAFGIDDGSTDQSVRLAQVAGVGVPKLPFNSGVGGVMRTAFLCAAPKSFDAVVQLDADGQHDPAQIQVLLDGLDTASIVVGARFAGVGDYQVRGPRAWAMRALAAAFSRVAHENLTGTASGFRATDRCAIRLIACHYPADGLGDNGGVVGDRRTGWAENHPGPGGGVIPGRRLAEQRSLALHPVSRAGVPGALHRTARHPFWAGASPVRPYWLGLAAAIGTALFIWEMLRRGISREKYAALWIFVSGALVVFAAFPAVVRFLATLVGVQLPANLRFLIGGFLLLLVSIQLSYEVSRLEARSRRIAEELALLRRELEAMKEDPET